MTHRQLACLPEPIARQLLAVDRRIRRLTVLKGFGKCLLVLSVLVGLALLLDWTWGLGSLTRAVILVSLALAAAWAVIQYALRPVVSRTSPVEVAAIAEAVLPGLNERISSTVELHDPVVPEREKGSVLMREKLTQQTISRINTIDLRQAVSSSSCRKWILIGTIAVMVLLLPFSFARDGYALLWARLIHPWGNYDQAANLHFELTPGDAVLARGSDLRVTAHPRFRFNETELPQQVLLEWQGPAGRVTTRRMQFQDAEQVYEVVIPSVLDHLEYRVRADSYQTRTYRITVVDPPVIERVELRITPPPYTGRPEQIIQTAVGFIQVFERSEIQLTTRFNKPAESAELIWTRSGAGVQDGSAEPSAIEESVSLNVSPDQRSATITFSAFEGGRLALRFQDLDGLTSQEDPYRVIQIISDQPPQVRYDQEWRPGTFRPGEVITAPLVATDDVGLGLLELLIEGETAEGSRLLARLQAPDEHLGLPLLHESFHVDTSKLNLQGVTALVLRGHTADERPTPGPQEAWTENWRLRLDDQAPAQAAEQVHERQRSWRDILEEVRQDVAQAREDTNALRREARHDARQQVDFRRDADLRRLIEIEVHDVIRLEQVAGALSAHPLYTDLTGELRDIAREPLSSAAAATREALDSATPAKQELLERAQGHLDETLDRLTAILERFDMLAELERHLAEVDRLARRAEQLSEDFTEFQQQQEQLSRLPESSAERQRLQEELLADHQQMQRDQLELAQDLNTLLDQNPELLDAARAFQRDRLLEFAEQARQIAQREDLLAELMQEQARDTANAFEPFAERQREIIDAAQEIAARSERNQPMTPVNPLNLQKLREALTSLEEGNIAQAVQDQLEAATELERLAEALRENDSLPADLQQAVVELAIREAALEQEISHLRDEIAANPAQEGQPPPQPTIEQRQSLRELAAEQAALLAAVARLPLTEHEAHAQRQAVQQAAETLDRLIVSEPEQARDSARRTEQALRELAERIGNEEQRRERATNLANHLRHQQQAVANELQHLNRQLAEGNAEAVEPARLAQLRERQHQIARQLAQMDAPGVEVQQRSALQELAEVLVDLQQENVRQAAESAREGEQALADLQHLLKNEPTAVQAVQEISRQEQLVQNNAAQALEAADSGRLRELAQQQRELAQQIQQVDAPLAREMQPQAQQALQRSADAMQRAADQSDSSRVRESVELALNEAAHQLARIEQRLNADAASAPDAGVDSDGLPRDQLAEQAPVSPAQQAEELAREQIQAAAQAREQSVGAMLPSAQELADQQQALQNRQDQLRQIPTPHALQEQARFAEAALSAAAQIQQQLNQQVSQARSRDPEGERPIEEPLLQALAANAEAHEAAAEIMEALANALGEPAAEQDLLAAQAELARTERMLMRPDVGPLQELASRALALAEQENRFAELARNLVENDILDAEQLHAQRRALEQQQRQLSQQVDQLPPSAAPMARAQARQSARQATQALAQGDFPQAAEHLQAAAQALEDLAAQTENLVVASAEIPLLPESSLQRTEEVGPAGASEAAEATPHALPAGEQIASQADALAERQRELAAELAAGLESLAGAAQPLASRAASPEAGMHSQPATPSAVTSPPGERASSNLSESPRDASQPAPTSGLPELIPAEAVAAQRELAEEAAQLATQVADAAGIRSPEFQQALSFAERAAQALEAAHQGMLPQAGRAAEQAAQQGRQTMARIEESPLNSAVPELASRTGDLSERQQKLAEAFQAMSRDATQRAAALAQGQQQIQQAAEQVASGLQDVADQLSQAPLDHSNQSELAGAAGETARQAAEAGGEAAQSITRQDLASARAQAMQAADALRRAAQAAEQAAAATAEMLPENPLVPPEFGEPVARAAQQLSQAAEQLAQSAPMASSNPAAQREMTSPEGAPFSDGQSAEAGAMPQQNPFLPVAQALQQAADQLSLNSNGQAPTSNPSSSASMQSSRFSEGSGTTQVPTLVELDLRLQRVERRNWGQLPGELETEILQASQRHLDSEYAELIREYFREISRQSNPIPQPE